LSKNIEDTETTALCDMEFDEQGVSNDFSIDIGYTDNNAEVHNTYAFRRMTGRDEEEIAKPSIKSNGGKMVNILLSRLVMRIGTLIKKDYSPQDWADIIKSLYSGDQDIMMVKIREANLGTELEAHHECPYEDCKAKLTTFFDLSELNLVHPKFDGEPLFSFELNAGIKTRKNTYKTGYLHLPTGHDREAITPFMIKNPVKASTLLQSRLIVFDNMQEKLTEDMVSNMIVKDRRILEKLLMDNNYGLNTRLETDCTECGRAIQLELGSNTNFL
jgi:hypothetical protein